MIRQQPSQQSSQLTSQPPWKTIALLIAAVLLLAGCTGRVPVSVISEQSVPPAPMIRVTPNDITADTLVSVSGTDWQPNEDIYLNLESQDMPELNATFAVARTTTDGSFNISFYFPKDERWSELDEILLVARAPNSGVESALSLKPLSVETAEGAVTEPTATPLAEADATPGAEAVATSVPARAAGEARVVGAQVNIRLGPSRAYPVIDVVAAGTSLKIAGQDSEGDWLRVRTPTGTDGWIATQFTNFTGSAPVVAAPPLVRPTTEPLITEWRGEYFANPELEGAPDLVRNDANVRFNWEFSAPTTNFPADRFSARWTRSLFFAAGTYNFYANVDDGVRVWVDDKLIIDAWREQSPKTHSGSHILSEGRHLVRVEYFEVGQRAEIDFWWERTGEFQNWQAEYYTNRQLSGTPALVRDDAAIDFNWGENVPAPGIPADDFSVRWTRSVAFVPGLYRFYADMDDGLRLYIDGTLVIDQWLDGGEREIATDVRLAEGIHAIRAEYYERSGTARAQLWWEKLEPATTFPAWKGEYWPNGTLSGGPALVRNDEVLNFDWNTGSPDFGSPVESFSARWTRRVQFESGTYRFFIDADDGVRLWINGTLLVDKWLDGPNDKIVLDFPTAAGWYDLRVEYFEQIGDARIQVRWEKLQPQTNYPDWQGEYFANQDLQGTPILVRNDPAIDFNWTIQSPADSLPRDRFSARWTRRITFEKGQYRLYARADDGIRIYIDGNLVLDRWEGNDGTEVYAVDRELNGSHRFTVEYFEELGGARVQFWWDQRE